MYGFNYDGRFYFYQHGFDDAVARAQRRPGVDGADDSRRHRRRRARVRHAVGHRGLQVAVGARARALRQRSTCFPPHRGGAHAPACRRGAARRRRLARRVLSPGSPGVPVRLSARPLALARQERRWPPPSRGRTSSDSPAALARGPERPLVLGYHRVVDDFDAGARTEMPSMLTSTAHVRAASRLRRPAFPLRQRSTRSASIWPAASRSTEPVAAVTFDDGYRDNYEHAFPMLKRKGHSGGGVRRDRPGRPAASGRSTTSCITWSTKAFAAWDDPRRELSALLRALGLPAGTCSRREPRRSTPMTTVVGAAAGPVAGERRAA